VNPKQIAAERAVQYVQDGMTVGLGTGSTSAFAVAALAQRVQNETLRLRCVATSLASAKMAQESGLQLADWDTVERLDLTIDGADEVDPEFRLIKGDERKVKAALGAFPLPVAVVPFAWQSTARRLHDRFGCPVIPRRSPNGALFISDDGLHVLDMAFGAPLPDPDTLEQELEAVVGVVETGLFVGLCQRLIVGFADGRVEEKTAPAP
jgi:ribose 5-phosphate isomerase A